MRFQLTEKVGGGDPEIVLEFLQTRLIRISRHVVRNGQTIEAYDIRTSFSSIVQSSTVVVSVRANRTSCLLTANVSYRPSLAFWFFLSVGLVTALGWLIPIALYMSQSDAIRATMEDLLQRVKAEREFNQSSVAEEVQACRNDAENGVIEAQLRLAIAYCDGDGVPQDFAEAARWTRKAAEQGSSIAQYNLGLAYYNGEGIHQDLAEAARWYRKAAEQGDVASQCNLGNMYCTGNGVPQDSAEGNRWLRMAAQQGDKTAQANLKIMGKPG